MRLMTEKELATALLHPKIKFAWFPVFVGKEEKLIFWKHYIRAPVGVWVDDCKSGRQLYQFRVGGSAMDGEGGQYNVHKNFELHDRSWFKVKYFGSKTMSLKQFLQSKIEGKYVPEVRSNV